MKVLCKLFSQCIVYAAEQPIVSTGLDSIIIWIVGLSTGLAVIGASVCLIRIMMADDPNQIAEAKGDLKQIAVAWLALNSLGAIIDTVFGLVDMMDF